MNAVATLDRFRDTGDRLVGLARDDILVACPACGRRAVDAPRPTDVRYVLCWPRRLSCHHCGHSAVWTPRLPSVWGGAVDPFFRTPLWLVAPCKGHTCGRSTWPTSTSWRGMWQPESANGDHDPVP